MPETPTLLYGSSWRTPDPIATNVGLNGQAEVTVGEYTLATVLPEMVTIKLGLQNLNPNLPLGGGQLQARITFGVGTANQTVLADWADGTTLHLPAGKITVQAITTAIPLMTPIYLTAQIARGDRSSPWSATLTYVVNVGVAAVIIPIPRAAKAVMVGSQKGITSDVKVSIFGHGATWNFFSLNQPADSLIRTSGVRLYGSADNVQLTSAGGEVQVIVCFILEG